MDGQLLGSLASQPQHVRPFGRNNSPDGNGAEENQADVGDTRGARKRAPTSSMGETKVHRRDLTRSVERARCAWPVMTVRVNRRPTVLFIMQRHRRERPKVKNRRS